MSRPLLEMLKGWEGLESDPDLEPGAISLVLYHADRLFLEYEPGGLDPFLLRLEKWLANADSDEDMKSLLSVLSGLFFIGRSEFNSLYRAAFGNICRWIIDEDNIDLAAVSYDRVLQWGQKATWICPITDSLRINGFLKVNGLSGHDHRPHWRSIAAFGDLSKTRDYLRSEGIRRLVLLEDFVGSGSQVKEAIEFACRELPDISVLFCPLVICPKGDEQALSLASTYTNLTYDPVLVLPDKLFVSETPVAGEQALLSRARALTLKLGHKLRSPVAEHFGYKKTGAMVVLYTNCPDNTLPLFRDEGGAWQPLFPRVWRPE